MSTQEANIDYRLYKKINEKPGSSIRELANEMGWSIVEVFKSVCRLESDNWIKSERDGNLVRITPVKWHEFLTPEESQLPRPEGHGLPLRKKSRGVRVADSSC